jgi:hypothetical protein
MDGLLQGAGLVLIIYGVASPREQLVRSDVKTSFSVVPTLSPAFSGLTARGTF